MNVLFVVWEVSPFFKVGGLGDIAYSLPIALHDRGITISLAVPLYDAVNLTNTRSEHVGTVTIVYDKKKVRVEILKVFFYERKIPIYFFKNKKYLSIPTGDTFAVYNLAIVKMIQDGLIDKPDIVHCNDNHAGFIPLLIKHNNLEIKTLFTIHNLNHFGRSTYSNVLKMGIDISKCTVLEWEIQKRKINFLLEGIVHADKVNAVSERYAEEILTEQYGAGIDEILHGLTGKISGILNGIDYNLRNPINDPYLQAHYDWNGSKKLLNAVNGKAKNKAFLQKKLGFEVKNDIPLISFIGRISPKQKGIQLIHRMIKRLNRNAYQFVLLGSGDADWEERFLWLSKFYKNIHYSNLFDEELASQIYAGSDFLLIPSKYEPCGLVQMIAMRYGTLPIARATGGLKDTIQHLENGFLFEKYTSSALERSVKKAVDIFQHHPVKMHHMIEHAMKKDFSWKQSAKKYIDLYKETLKES